MCYLIVSYTVSKQPLKLKNAPKKGRFLYTMSKQRMVNTHFWSDPWVVDELNPLDRYLFLYFLTNDKNNLAGVYEISIRTISNETGLEKEEVSRMLKRLESRVKYHNGWIVLRKSIKHQNYNNSKIRTAILHSLRDAPEDVLQFMDMPQELGFMSNPLADRLPVAGTSPMSQPSVTHEQAIDQRTPLAYEPSSLMDDSSHSNSNINFNSNSNKSSPAGKPQDRTKQIDEIKEIFDYYINCFEAQSSHIKLSDKRRTHIRMRLRDAGREMLMKAILNTSRSDWHRGENDRAWKANIDFIIRSYEQVEKLAEMDPVATIGAGETQRVSDEDMRRIAEKL